MVRTRRNQNQAPQYFNQLIQVLRCVRLTSKTIGRHFLAFSLQNKSIMTKHLKLIIIYTNIKNVRKISFKYGNDENSWIFFYISAKNDENQFLIFVVENTCFFYTNRTWTLCWDCMEGLSVPVRRTFCRICSGPTPEIGRPRRGWIRHLTKWNGLLLNTYKSYLGPVRCKKNQCCGSFA